MIFVLYQKYDYQTGFSLSFFKQKHDYLSNYRESFVKLVISKINYKRPEDIHLYIRIFCAIYINISFIYALHFTDGNI